MSHCVFPTTPSSTLRDSIDQFVTQQAQNNYERVGKIQQLFRTSMLEMGLAINHAQRGNREVGPFTCRPLSGNLSADVLSCGDFNPTRPNYRSVLQNSDRVVQLLAEGFAALDSHRIQDVQLRTELNQSIKTMKERAFELKKTLAPPLTWYDKFWLGYSQEQLNMFPNEQ